MVLAAICLNASASEYYIDYASGADGNLGNSVTAPWQHSPGDPAATAVVATAKLTPGDTIHFKGGVTYILTGSSGIGLNWNGAPGSPITYDGNSAGSWGNGRALFTDNHGDRALAAFSSAGNASYLSFTNLDLGAIGGAASLPVDSGAPTAPRFGAGFVFNGAIVGVTIDSCALHDLGYTFNQRPMSTDSIAGAGISFRGGSDVTITNCTFSQIEVGLDLAGSASVSNLKIANCVFSGAMVWTISAPANLTFNNLSIYGCVEVTNGMFDRAAWTGYGKSPRVTSRIATEGTAISFATSVVASPDATYQWRKNGVPISGATNYLFALPAVTVADSGVYTVVASNAAGFTESNDAELTVTAATTPPTSGNAPVITAQPANAAVATFGTAIFSVTATGTPAPTYQWLRGGIAFAGWTGSTLVLDGVSSNDVGAYSVVVTNSAGSVTSNSALLSIGTATPTAIAPTFTTQPTSLTVNANTSAAFVATVVGDPAPTVQWLKDGAPLAGQTSGTLSLANTTSSDAGVYSLLATNSAGSVTSNAATLTVVTNSSTSSAPVITAQPANAAVATFGTAIFSVTATGTPAPTYQWFRNGVAFAGWTSATLVLEGISSNDVGSYSVVVTNSSGTVASSAAFLSIGTATPTAIAPSFTTQPDSATVNTNASATFAVAVSGSPAPTLQWLNNGAPLAGETNATLTLPNVTSADAGVYSVLATNSAGSAASSSAILIVVTPSLAPTIATQPANVSVAPFATATFSVAATGTPAPTYQWFRNGVAFAGWTNATLVLEGISSNDVGGYSVVVTNSLGSVTSNSATLSVSAPKIP